MKYLLLLLFLVVGCNETPETPVVVTPEVPVVVTPEVPVTVKLNIVDEITKIAEVSKCASYSWKNRGKAPKSYMKGMALSYGHEVCFPNKIVSSAYLGPSNKDVLTHYGLPANSLNVYALLIGAGMRESSGKYCCGRDMSSSNTSSDTAEAGMFQTSYNSHVASPELDFIFNDFKNNQKNCLNIFKENVSCSPDDSSNYGSGNGLKFQQMAKDCPAFAVQYAAVTMRVLYRHYGPLIRKEAEYRQECVDMLKSVEKVVKENLSHCEKL